MDGLNVIKGDAIYIKFSLLLAFRVVTPTKSYSGIYILEVKHGETQES